MISSLMAHEAQQALKLLDGYSFELGQYNAEGQIVRWLQTYRATWIRDAIVEALYQGRYKAISVQQILALWDRRGQPVRHFSPEFEQAVGRPVGLQLAPLSLPSPGNAQAMAASDSQTEEFASTTPPLQNLETTDNDETTRLGVLYTMRQPIQPFQPEAPLRPTNRKSIQLINLDQSSRR